MFYESHAHYNDEAFDKDRDIIIKKINENNVLNIINVGTSIKTSEESINIAQKYDYIYASVGIHPNKLENINEEDIKILEDLSKKEKVVAIGEIGLDYYYEKSSKDKQKYWFKKQLELAKKINFPIIVHSRNAEEDTFNIIKDINLSKRNKKGAGVIHCYSGDYNLAKKYIKLGYYIGVGGIVTFKNAKKLVDVVKYIDLENILLETDSPYLSPEPNRGKRNDSTNLKYIAQKISEIKEINIEKVNEITTKNCKALFN